MAVATHANLVGISDCDLENAVHSGLSAYLCLSMEKGRWEERKIPATPETCTNMPLVYGQFPAC